MSKILSPGELAINQLITVLEWEPIVHEPDAFSAMVGITTATTHRDNSYKGDVLQVTAIMLPYVVTKRLTGGWKGEPSLDLDTRRVKLMEVTKEYATARGVVLDSEVEPS